MKTLDDVQVLIVEDEPLIAETIKDYLIEMGISNCRIAFNKNEAIRLCKENEPDLVLLDIRMEGRFDGIELGEIMQAKDIAFMYVTAHSDMMMDKKMAATKAMGFISKPIRKNEFKINVNFVLNTISENQKSKEKKVNVSSELLIRDGQEIIKFDRLSLAYIKSSGNYLEIYNDLNEFILIRNTIEKFLNEANDENFVQTHRSFIVNLNQIERISTSEIILKNKYKVPISRNYREKIKIVLP